MGPTLLRNNIPLVTGPSAYWRSTRRQMFLGAVLVTLAIVLFTLMRLPRGGGEGAIATGFIPKTANFKLVNTTLSLEVATSTEARTKGLGGRESLPEHTALLLVFPEDGAYGIWMKDMLFAIDVLWIDSRGTIVDLVERMAPETYPRAFIPNQEVRYVIEAPAGFIRANEIALSDMVNFK